MIGRDTGGGSSFAGAGLYYLHDRNADTDERVAFTHTENLLTDNPEVAMKVMAWTAMHQADLKAAAGVKATGRKLEKPVHTFVLSWAPGEQPEHAHMIETAKSAMTALGLAEHEAVYVGHDDTDKAHVHIIVNRVHPETGKAATLSKSRLALSRWAEAYEKAHGIHCHQRIENNRRRAQGDRVIDLKSRRRNVEQFADWREKRKQEAVTSDHEKKRFYEWADRRRAELAEEEERAKKGLEKTQAVRQQRHDERVERTYRISDMAAKLRHLDQELAVGGVRGFLRRLSGHRKRLEQQREDQRRALADARQRRDEALASYRRRLKQERQALAERYGHKTRGLEERITNAKARRAREGWRSMKVERHPDILIVQQSGRSRSRGRGPTI